MPDPRQDSHRPTGWILLLAALLTLGAGAAARFAEEQVADLTGLTGDQIAAVPYLALAVLGLVALVAGARFAFARRPKAPVAKRAAGNNLVEIAPAPKPEPPPAEPAPAAEPPKREEPAYWPADQAVGLSWSKASDAVKPPPSA
jgi:hypothetical protein